MYIDSVKPYMDLDSDACHVTVTLAESGRVSDCLVVGRIYSLGGFVGRHRRSFALCSPLGCILLEPICF